MLWREGRWWRVLLGTCLGFSFSEGNKRGGGWGVQFGGAGGGLEVDEVAFDKMCRGYKRMDLK